MAKGGAASVEPCVEAAPSGEARDESDLYTKLKLLQRHLEFLDIQEEYIKDEQKNLKRELLRAQQEVKRIQSVPLVIGQFLEMVDATYGIVGSTTGSNYYVRIQSQVNRELLKPGASVALHRHSNALVDVLPPEADSSISLMSASEKPDVTYAVRARGESLSPPALTGAFERLPVGRLARAHSPARGHRTSAVRTSRSRRSARLWSCR
jgi:26S proteasome regulatory subunit T3